MDAVSQKLKEEIETNTQSLAEEKRRVDAVIEKTKQQIQELTRTLVESEKQSQELSLRIQLEQAKYAETMKGEHGKLDGKTQASAALAAEVQEMERLQRRMDKECEDLTDALQVVADTEKTAIADLDKQTSIIKKFEEIDASEAKCKPKLIELRAKLQTIETRIAEKTARIETVAGKAKELARLEENLQTQVKKCEDEKDAFVTAKQFQVCL